MATGNADVKIINIDRYTREGHERFKNATQFNCPDGKRRSFGAWLDWMKTWNPQTTDPEGFEEVRKKVEADRRGPGIARRK